MKCKLGVLQTTRETWKSHLQSADSHRNVDLSAPAYAAFDGDTAECSRKVGISRQFNVKRSQSRPLNAITAFSNVIFMNLYTTEINRRTPRKLTRTGKATSVLLKSEEGDMTARHESWLGDGILGLAMLLGLGFILSIISRAILP